MEKMNNVLQYTGSRYDGEIKSERMEGKGTYSFASGTRYEGELLDGRFHGAGVLHMTSGASIEGVWIKGKLIERKLTFSDGLKFDESDEWEYCQPNDRFDWKLRVNEYQFKRRFYTEICNGLKPAGRSQLTNEPRDVKKDHYDTGFCLFFRYDKYSNT